MFFSIIVPVYNVEEYLQQCIDSVLQQSFKNFELLLIDDGSKDGSGKICDQNSWVDKRVITIHKSNGGAADSRNVGLIAAKGKYVVYLDSDDFIVDKTFLEKLNKKAEQNVDIILYNYIKYFETTKTYSNLYFHYPPIEGKERRAEVVKKLVEQDAFYAAAWMKAVRTDLLKQNHVVFQSGIRSEDQEWYYHVVLCANTYAVVDEPFVVYRQRAGSVTATFSEKHLLDNIKILEDWGKKIKEEILELEFRDALLSSMGKLYSNLLIAYSSLDKEVRNRNQKRMKMLSWLLCYDWNPRTKKMNRIYHIVGFKGIVCLLSTAQKIRRRQ